MLTLLNLHKSYTPNLPVLAGVTLSVAQGEIVCLLGPSGCGKTTLLRIIAGLEVAEQGSVLVDGHDLADTPVHTRNFGFMFQDFALFPHRTVGENIAFGLRMAGQSGSAIAQRVTEMLELVNLQSYATRSVFELSGGERQRVALARSLAPNPRLLMLDEPLGSLDRSLREELMDELRAILKRIDVTALYVTHDQQEAFAVADRLVLMNHGVIEQTGTPEEVYQQPRNEFVARFLGFHNLLPATLQPTNETDCFVAETAIGAFEIKEERQEDKAFGEFSRAETRRSASDSTELVEVSAEPRQGVRRATRPSSSRSQPSRDREILLIRPDALVDVSKEGREVSNLPRLRGQWVGASFRGNHYQVKIAVAPKETTAPRVILQFEVANLQMLQSVRSLNETSHFARPSEFTDFILDPEKIKLLSNKNTT